MELFTFFLSRYYTWTCEWFMKECATCCKYIFWVTFVAHFYIILSKQKTLSLEIKVIVVRAESLSIFIISLAMYFNITYFWESIVGCVVKILPHHRLLTPQTWRCSEKDQWIYGAGLATIVQAQNIQLFHPVSIDDHF